MSLSIGVVSVKSPHRRLSPERVAELATSAMAKAKANNGNCVFVELYDECADRSCSTHGSDLLEEQERSQHQPAPVRGS